MQEAAVLQYKTWQQQMPLISNKSSSSNSATTTSSSASSSSVLFHLKGGSFMKNMVKENPVIVFGKRGCCMSHVVKRLLQGLGVNPPVYEVDEKDENEVVNELQEILSVGDDGGSSRGGGAPLQFPAVFIGGQLFGGLDRIMAAHITGELTPVLKKAGALWL